jgi:hypothetical protein
VLLLVVGGSVTLLISGALSPAGAVDSSKGFAFTDKGVLAYYHIWSNEDNGIKTATEGGRLPMSMRDNLRLSTTCLAVALAGLQSTGEAFTMICTSRRIMVAV